MVRTIRHGTNKIARFVDYKESGHPGRWSVASQRPENPAGPESCAPFSQTWPYSHELYASCSWSSTHRPGRCLSSWPSPPAPCELPQIMASTTNNTYKLQKDLISKRSRYWRKGEGGQQLGGNESNPQVKSPIQHPEDTNSVLGSDTVHRASQCDSHTHRVKSTPNECRDQTRRRTTVRAREREASREEMN